MRPSAFGVPTVTFRGLYVWFAIGHGRRRILHLNIFDRDSIFSGHVITTVKSFGIQPTRTALRSPWQNGVAERWVGSVRRELLDHVVVFNERHLRRLRRDYVAYCHDDRTHLGLGKATPMERLVERRPDEEAEVVALPRVGGLHHRYEWRAAA